MIQSLSFMWSYVRSLISEETGQDGFEYLLVVGGVSVAIVVAMAAVPGLTTGLVAAVCAAINTVITPDMSCT